MTYKIFWFSLNFQHIHNAPYSSCYSKAISLQGSEYNEVQYIIDTDSHRYHLLQMDHCLSSGFSSYPLPTYAVLPEPVSSHLFGGLDPWHFLRIFLAVVEKRIDEICSPGTLLRSVGPPRGLVLHKISQFCDCYPSSVSELVVR
jgi:hypothetical protein